MLCLAKLLLAVVVAVGQIAVGDCDAVVVVAKLLLAVVVLSKCLHFELYSCKN